MPSSIRAQTAVRGGSGEQTPADSTELHGGARREQRRFEAERFTHLPVTLSYPSGGECDEVVGRFCVWWNESPDWTPKPEPPEIQRFRDTLLVRLDSIQRLLPGDGWVLGQRVWYRAEGGQWTDALATARRCGTAEPWWCAALEGFALHGLGRYRDAQAAFRRALEAMPAKTAQRWRVPHDAVDGGTASLLEHATPARRDTLLHRLWLLADPLYLVAGNDRLTAHYARWTVATLRRGAANAFRISWGSDMEELMVRHGWARSWERTRDRFDPAARDGVVGHDDPEGREFMPPQSAVEDPSTATAKDLEADVSRPRSLYQPAYTPVILPMDGQLAVFPRRDSVVVVATTFVPRDTTAGARKGRARPWMDPGANEGRPDEEGLFLEPLDGGGEVRSERFGPGPAGLLVRAPAGRWIVSAEAWSPEHRVAGRLRRGIHRDTVPRDVATLSDLLLVRSSAPEPATLAAAAADALPRPRIASGETFRLVWEVGGLGWRQETVAYALTVERADPGFLRRAGELLHLVGRERPLSLHWVEAGPSRPRMALRSVRLDLPDLDRGAYRVRLEARLAGRNPLVSEVVFRVSVR